jgi:ribosomal protein S18 acetylase RimI-like enzyme
MLKNSQTQIEKTAQILTEGFIDDPSFAFIFGENANKFQALNAFFKLLATDAIQRGEVIIAPEEQGACIWYPAEVEIFNEQFEQIVAETISTTSHFCGVESGKRFEEVIEKVGASEPEAIHCEVLFIALKPKSRGKGIGESLLKPVLNYADTKKFGCYLASSNYRNISFYERYGFRKFCPIEISDSYSMTGMWRENI